MATTSYGTPYVQSSDLVSGWPNASLNVANRIDQVSYAGNGINAQTVTSYTLAVTDAGKLVTLNNAAAVAVSLPQDSTANLPVGSVTRIYNLGAGLVTVQAGSGATLQGGSVTVAQYDACDVTKLSANTYGIAAKASISSLALSYITSSSFSSASAVNLNGCFTSTYQNYRIYLRLSAASTALTLSMRMRASGSDDTGSNYSRQINYGTGSTVGAGQTLAATSWPLCAIDATYAPYNQIVIDIGSPAESVRSMASYLATLTETGANYYALHGAIWHLASTSYDGFSIFTSTGNVSGTVRVYGYRNS